MQHTISKISVKQAKELLLNNELIIYPTEAVFGIGCIPGGAINRIIALKQRDLSKGLLLVAKDISQIKSLILPSDDIVWDKIEASWPGPITWVFPASDEVHPLLKGKHNSIAIRVSAHPVVQQLCEVGPIVSTSCNLQNQPAITNEADLAEFAAQAKVPVVEGELGGRKTPSSIIDAVTEEVYR